MPSFNAETTFDDVAAAYPGLIRGRSFLVTGATSGLGLEFCRSLAKHGVGTIIISGRSREQLQQVSSEITALGNDTIVKSVVMDLTDFDSVKQAAAEVNALNLPIDVLVNNAGVMAVPFKKIHGYEHHFVANHLGQFLFTNLVLGALSQGARIVIISAGAHGFSPVRFDDINFRDGKVYNKWAGYGQSKSANILFAKSLNTKLASTGTESFSIHPGVILTNLSRELEPAELRALITPVARTAPVSNTITISVEQGIATHLYAAISPDLKGKGGAYLARCQVQEPSYPMTDADAEKLWNLSNEILGTTF